jgi:gliding motility-associated-like protein
MASKIHFLPKVSFFNFIIILTFLIFSSKGTAQCAGQDASITICDIPNPTSQTINLFSLLGGTPTPGGSWNDDLLSGGLNTVTGILNAQVISESAVYTYTYTVTGVTGCTDNESTVTVTIGGYPGVSGPNASVCSDDGTYNLFQLFDGNFLGPQSNGIWSDDDNSGFSTSNILNVQSAIGSLPFRTLHFTYTMPAIGSCPAKAAVQGSVTIYRAPEEGIPTDLPLCNSDFASFSTNFDLNSLLSGEDPGGKWREISGTAEITSAADRFVNIKNIYTTLGAGSYSFIYTVLPTNPACSPKTATVRIIIEDILDFTGSTFVVNSDICENNIATATYSATLTQGLQNISNGLYNVTYTVSGSNGGTNTITASFNGGVLSFPLSSNFFQQAGVFNVTITNVTLVGSRGICTNIINIPPDAINVFPKPNINNEILTINPICEKDAATVVFSGTNNLSDGNYQITYNLLGNNLATAQTAIITATGGVISNFTIPASLIPIPGNLTVPTPGNTSISITNIVNLITNCSNTVVKIKPFIINPLPVDNFGISISNVCQSKDLVVNLSGLTNLTNITIVYNLSGVNSTSNLSQTLVVNAAGNTNFTIPTLLIPNTGTTTFTVTYITNDVTTCGRVVNVTKDFTVNILPLVPVSGDQNFCKTDVATVANLLPLGTQYQWFNSTATTATPLASTFVLVTGNYYIREINVTTGCVSPFKMIKVVINELPPPTLNTNGQNFCKLDKPTLQSLSNNSNSTATIVWFDAATGGNLLANTILLQDATTYYGFDFSSITNCYSENNLSVTVSLTNCNVTPDFYIPDGFSPNGDAVNDTFSIPDIQFIFPNYSLEIYNRYGSLMFKGDKNNPNWDGKNSQSANLIDTTAPNGVYFYVINFNKDNASPKQGRLYLNR